MIVLLLLILVASLVTALGIARVESKYEKITFAYSLFDNFVMAIFTFYMFFTAVRVLLRDTESTIVDSYGHSDARTALHYALPLLCVSIFMIVCAFLLIKRKHSLLCKIRETYNSVLLLILILFNEFSLELIMNIETFYFYIVVLLFIPIYIFIKNGQKQQKEDAISRFKKDSPVFLFVAFMEWIFVPCEIYFSNTEEMLVQYRYWEKMAFIAFVVTVIIFVAVMLCADELIYSVVRVITFAYGVMLYIQYLFLNRSMKELTGVSQYWSTNAKYTNLIIWSVFIMLMLMLSLWKSAIARKAIFGLSLIMLLTQCFTFVTLRLTNRFDYSNVADLSIEGMTELSDKNNVVVFVLDSFDGQTMDKFIDEDVEELRYFDDFVYYGNATSRYAFTAMALPYILSGGIEADSREGDGYAQTDFLKDIHNKMYDIRLYTGISYISADVADKYVDNYETSDKKQYINYDKLYLLIKKMSKYSTYPFIIKNKYDYNSADFSFIAYNYGYDISYDVPFYEYLDANRVAVNNENEGAFRLYHLAGSHIPYLMNRNCEYADWLDVYDQTLGDMNIIGLYLDSMKNMGVYDQSLIIVMADHGQNYSMWDEQHSRFLSTYEGYNYTSSPMIMVKYPRSQGDAISINNNPVSQAELPQTIAEYIGLSNTYGRTFDDILPDENRKRYFQFFDQVYEIDGDVKDEKSWTPNVAALRE